MAETVPRRHSKLGIASCVAAVAVWIYFALIFYLFFFVDGFSKFLGDLTTPASRGISDFRGIGAAIVIMAVIFFIIPAAGHLVGLILAIAGLFGRSKKRVFPVTGIFLNLLPMFILLALFLIGSLAPAK